MIILVLWFLLMGPPSSLRICSMKQWIIFITIFTFKIYSTLEVKLEHIIIIIVQVTWQTSKGIGLWLELGGRKPQEGALMWYELPMIFWPEGVNTRAKGIFFKVLVQVVLLFGLEMWVTTPHMVRALGIFQNRVDHCLTEIQMQRIWDGSWDYPPLEEAMEDEMWDVGLDMEEAYVLRRKNKVTQCYWFCTSVKNWFRGRGHGL